MHHNVNSRVIIFLVHISNNMVRARPLKFFFYQYQVHLSLPLRFLSRIYDIKLYIYFFYACNSVKFKSKKIFK